MDKVAIVIPSWNGRHHLERCLPSLLAQDYGDVEIVLVDNGSSDGTAEWVRSRFPQVKLIQCAANLGPAAARNLAFRQLDVPLVATVDNDTAFEPDWLRRLVDGMGLDRRIGMVASKVTYMEPAGIIDSAGIDVDRAGFTWNRFNGCPDDGRETEPYQVFGAVTCACLFRKDMLDDVGLFDESFFIYCDDPDLCWRAQLRGWRCLYVPAARACHFHSASMRRNLSLKRFLTARNRVWAVAKNYHSPDLWQQLPRLVFYDLLSMVSRVVKERSASPVSGRLAALSRLPRFLGERKIVQNRRTATPAYLNAAMAPFPPLGELMSGRRTPHRVVD